MSQSFSPSWKDLGKLSERLVQRLAEQGSRTTRSTASSRSGHVLPKTSPAASCASVTPRQSQGTLESKFEDKKNGIAVTQAIDDRQRSLCPSTARRELIGLLRICRYVVRDLQDEDQTEQHGTEPWKQSCPSPRPSEPSPHTTTPTAPK
ncbi:hypothetical protein CF336_g9689 [Tilletia laevis]|nr:hypothetical protein CF336_g9689 [Tilletia laevis]KAE8180403.1 hypothetical protein CF335_g9262 [Tilletia laevis]